MANKPIIARFPDGSEYGFATPAQARKVHPDAKIVSYQDGSVYEEPETRAPAKKQAEDAKE